jgi:lysophospholipase L1-like esterase
MTSMNKWNKISIAVVLFFNFWSNPVFAASLIDYGDPNAKNILPVFKTFRSHRAIHWVQIGDSHTAGDYLTDRLRVRLQDRIGDGGLGWIMPMYASGQRMARVGYDQQNLQLLSSRTDASSNIDFPFGGLIAKGTGLPASLTIKPKIGDRPLQNITVITHQSITDPISITDADQKQIILKGSSLDAEWAYKNFTARLPFTVQWDGNPNTRIGGWWLRSTEPGVIVSAVGINGSELAHWSRWRSGWMNDLAAGEPSLIAIAYGTNEAFRKDLRAEDFYNTLTKAIEQLRENFPRASVLIMGAPESLISLEGACGQRPPALDAVQEIQRHVAIQKKTLFWDWQEAMGGKCSMKSLVNQGYARKDGVHFTPVGYEDAADALFNSLTQ